MPRTRSSRRSDSWSAYTIVDNFGDWANYPIPDVDTRYVRHVAMNIGRKVVLDLENLVITTSAVNVHALHVYIRKEPR